VLERDGITAFTAFIGNPTGHSYTLGRYMPLFIGQSGMPHIYSSGTVDQWPKNVSCVLMYGNMWKIPSPDIQRTDYLVCMGGNPQASGGSLLACPDVLSELDAIRERGGKVIVVDPRRTGTADHADEWVPILPGTDAAFLAEEIATPGDGQIKALFTVAGNPVISVPGWARLEAALPELECMIAVDNYLNETTRFAHVLLPGRSPLETPHYDELLWGWAARSGGNWSDAIFPMAEDRPHEGQIIAHSGGTAPAARTRTSTSRRSTTPGSARCAAPRASTPTRRSPGTTAVAPNGSST
jgi:anaerobic selenocysteine-containing dehydrogenase